MSLRLHLILVIGALVTFAALSQGLLQLGTLADSLGKDASKQGQLAGQQVASFLTDHVNQHSKDRATPATEEDTRIMRREIVATDPDIANMLEKMMALSRSLLEINVADGSRTVLVSSNPLRAGMPLGSLQPFTDWEKWP